MAKVIHRLWKDGNNDPFIMPGNLPLYDAETRNELIYYLPQGWDPVVEGDIDGERSETVEIETYDPRFGSVQACRRLARTIFLGSAPTTTDQTVRGIDTEHLLLGVLQPGQQIGVYKDAVRRLTDKLHYLNSANHRFWFDVRPNLRREMEDRKRRFTSPEQILPEIQNRVRTLIQATTFAGIHVFPNSSDVPDDWRMHLVVLPPAEPFSKIQNPAATKAALEMLNNRGDQPRLKRNRVLFLAADSEATARLDDLICSFKAWESIVLDFDKGDLNLDRPQSTQARSSCTSASDAAMLLKGEGEHADNIVGGAEWSTRRSARAGRERRGSETAPQRRNRACAGLPALPLLHSPGHCRGEPTMKGKREHRQETRTWRSGVPRNTSTSTSPTSNLQSSFDLPSDVRQYPESLVGRGILANHA
jgi:predicted AAA+ superfamily ATPase